MCGSDVFLALIAILFPPIAVWVKRGLCSADSIINICLCCLGFLPGLLHAWYIISVTPDPTYVSVPNEDPEQGRVTYYYVHTQPRYEPVSSDPSYGTVNPDTPKMPAPRQQQQQQQQGVVAAGSSANADADEVPPTYQQAVGDHKVQK